MPKGQYLTQEQKDLLVALRAEGKSVNEIAALTGASTTTIIRHTKAQRNGRNRPTDSGRDRLLAAVVDHGPVADVLTLIGHTPDLDGHSAMHLLYSLAKAGLVRFREQKKGNTKTLLNIEATRAGRLIVEAAREGVGTPTEVSPSPVAPEAAPDPAPLVEAVVPWSPRRVSFDDLPLIRALRDRRRHLEAAAKSLEAAGQDEMALDVMAKIDDHTPLEEEVLSLLALAIEDGIVLV